MPRKPKSPKQVEAFKHGQDHRKNIPTAEMESFFRREEDHDPLPPESYERARPLEEGERRARDEDLDPQLVWKGARIKIKKEQMDQLAKTGELELGDAQLVWRGKDQQDWSDLIVNVPPLYIQEKIHPKAIIDDLKRRTEKNREAESDAPDLFADFNGLDDPEARAEFYQHDQHWSNRLILGDSLQVMASLAQRENLRGKVQCIYIDPPYGIKFGSNWQVSTLSRDVKEGKQEHVSREPEQVKAFRDTWKDGIHSYLTYLRDRLTVARELLTESGSCFVQIGDENVHRVRALMDEVFGEDNFICAISAQKTGSQSGNFLQATSDDILWFAKDKARAKSKFRPLFLTRSGQGSSGLTFDREDYGAYPLTSEGIRSTSTCEFSFEGKVYHPGRLAHWKVVPEALERVAKAHRILPQKAQIRFRYFFDDYPVTRLGDYWNDVGGATGKVYVVQSSPRLVERCLLMTTDPGDLVLDPTCGSGTTAYVAEQWGRRWITVDTSRVALALARTRIMSAKYPWYLLADSEHGQQKIAEIEGTAPATHATHDDIRHGFVYERVPHITLGRIGTDTEIDVIWERLQPAVEAARAELNAALKGHSEPFKVESGGRAGEKIDFTASGEVELPSGESAPANGLMEWEVPREAPEGWPEAAKTALNAFWEARIARQSEIDASIAAAADFETLYDKPYEDKSRIRVAGPFTVESLSPHRVLPASEDELIEDVEAAEGQRRRGETSQTDFADIVLEYLKSEGVHQTEKGGKIDFESVTPWPGEWISAEARFVEGEDGARVERRAGVFIGPEYGTVGRSDLIAAAREAVDARFDLVIACAFNFDAHSTGVEGLGGMRIVKARINPDMHMSDELKNTGKGNMFVVFGEPDIEVLDEGGEIIRVKVNGVDVFDPNTGEIRSNDVKGIAAWFIDTDYDEESFFVRHAYFLGANDPYKSLKTALKAEIDEDAWSSLYRDISRPFERPESGRIAVKVINHFGDEVMKVVGV